MARDVPAGPRLILFHRGVAKPEPRRDSPFLLKMRELEMMSPEHAKVLMDLAADILKERRHRVWSLE